ncbi:hypothetical protein PsWM33_04388 [Pseudovibrio sp. WM33]|nr:hypothetical protein PsWM33_04388 [Pseudovibrio sp. WM33]
MGCMKKKQVPSYISIRSGFFLITFRMDISERGQEQQLDVVRITICNWGQYVAVVH